MYTSYFLINIVLWRAVSAVAMRRGKRMKITWRAREFPVKGARSAGSSKTLTCEYISCLEALVKNLQHQTFLC